MTAESLLTRRFRAVYKNGYHYPGSPFAADEIIEPALNEIDLYVNHSHLFCELPWYSERELADMPLYLKVYQEGGEIDFVLKVERYINHGGTNIVWAFAYYWMQESDLKRYSIQGWLPATEQEHNEFLESYKL